MERSGLIRRLRRGEEQEFCLDSLEVAKSCADVGHFAQESVLLPIRAMTLSTGRSAMVSATYVGALLKTLVASE